MKAFNWTLMGHLLPVKPFLSLLYDHLGGRKFFYWSLWPKTGTSRVLKAQPIDQAINQIYLCVDQFGDQRTSLFQDIWQYCEH